MTHSTNTELEKQVDEIFYMLLKNIKYELTPMQLRDYEERQKVARIGLISLIRSECARERIEELEKLSKASWSDLAYDIPNYLKDRIAELSNQQPSIEAKKEK